MVQAIGAGARGYLSKQAEETEIVGAIGAVAQGRTYVSATLASYPAAGDGGSRPQHDPSILCLEKPNRREQGRGESGTPPN